MAPPDDDAFAAPSSDPDAPREGPPDDWERDSWFDFANGEWWYRFPSRGEGGRGGTEGVWRRDPPPVVPLGFVNGEYIFVTRARELRRFTSGQLHGRGGMADLFGGDERWVLRHFEGRDREGAPSGRPNAPALMGALIRQCVDHSRFYDGSIPMRSVGTWRGPDGAPLVHAGDRIFWNGSIHQPGEAIGEARYVLGSDRQAPSYVNTGHDGYEWHPATLSDCAKVLAHLDEWHWAEPEALELYAGWLWCALLGDAPRWKPHVFVRAVAGSGKSTLLKYVAALLGGAAHPPQRTYTRARLEERFSHTACALLLEEAEGDPGQEAERVKRVLDMLLQLSDEGAVGGKFKREIDLHGLATLVATLTDEWRTTLKSRITLLELRRLRDREHPLMSDEALAAMMSQAAAISPGLRALAIARWPLFVENVGRIRRRLLELGGQPRDADQVGHQLAGWACLSWDEPIPDDELGQLDRFRDYIITLRDASEGLDDASECWNTLLGLPAELEWHGGRKLTIGQVIARARQPDGDGWREKLLPYGLRLQKLPRESWTEAWLAIANRHPGLESLFSGYQQYRGGRYAQILKELGQGEHRAKPSDRAIRFAGPQSRAVLVPTELLPSMADEKHDADPRTPTEIPE